MSATRHSEMNVLVRASEGSLPLTVPDVFPTQDGKHDLTGIHDVITGYVPYSPNGGYPTRREGWLRIAMQTGGSPAYLDPSLPPELQEEIVGNYRESHIAPIEVIGAHLIPRRIIDLSRAVQKMYYDQVGLYVGVSQKPAERKVESALAFRGTINVPDADGNEIRRNLQGIHFRSGHLLGWARIFR